MNIIYGDLKTGVVKSEMMLASNSLVSPLVCLECKSRRVNEQIKMLVLQGLWEKFSN